MSRTFLHQLRLFLFSSFSFFFFFFLVYSSSMESVEPKTQPTWNWAITERRMDRRRATLMTDMARESVRATRCCRSSSTSQFGLCYQPQDQKTIKNWDNSPVHSFDNIRRPLCQWHLPTLSPKKEGRRRTFGEEDIIGIWERKKFLYSPILSSAQPKRLLLVNCDFVSLLLFRPPRSVVSLPFRLSPR